MVTDINGLKRDETVAYLSLAHNMKGHKMKTEKIYTDTKYVKRHFLNTLDKRYLNKDDKEFLLQSFEILENHIKLKG